MRIYNGKNCQICVPMLGTKEMLELGPKSVSPNLVPTKEFLELLTRSFTPEEIALVVAGAFEYNVCANIPLASNFTVTSLDEAIERFQVKVKSEPTVVENLEEAEKIEEVKEEEVAETPCCNCGDCENCSCHASEETPEVAENKEKKSKKKSTKKAE